MKSQVKIQWKTPLIAFVLRFIFTNGELIGQNICLEEKIYLANVTEYYIRNITVRNYEWCYNIPPRCSFYVSRKINDTKIVEKNKTAIIEICCPGYVQSDDSCVPDCTGCTQGFCENGKCICPPECELACSCNHVECNSLEGCSQQTKSNTETTPHTTTSTSHTSQIISQNETPQTSIELPGEGSEPKVEARRELIQKYHGEIMFGDQQQDFTSTTDRTTQSIRDYFRPIEVPYRHNFQTGTWNIYLKLIVPIFALVILIIVIICVYFLSKMGDRNSKRRKTPCVRTASILNDPLPDPPKSEEIKLTSVEYGTTQPIGSPIFETVVGSMEQESDHQKSDSGDILYDHPRSTKICKAVSLDKPNEITSSQRSEPIYDEVLFENPFLYILH